MLQSCTQYICMFSSIFMHGLKCHIYVRYTVCPSVYLKNHSFHIWCNHIWWAIDNAFRTFIDVTKKSIHLYTCLAFTKFVFGNALEFCLFFFFVCFEFGLCVLLFLRNSLCIWCGMLMRLLFCFNSHCILSYRSYFRNDCKLYLTRCTFNYHVSLYIVSHEWRKKRLRLMRDFSNS